MIDAVGEVRAHRALAHRGVSSVPIRFFLPLPGPFVYVGRSRIERDYIRAQRAERIARLSPQQRSYGGLALAALLWFVLLSAFWQAGPAWGVPVTVALVAWAVFVVVSKRRRGLRFWQDD